MFHKAKSLEEGKKLYRKLALRLHPDTGGDNELMILLEDSFELFKSFIETCVKEKEIAERYTYEKVFENVNVLQHELTIIEDIKRYAETHAKFEMSFIDSVIDFLETKGYVTSSQYNSLVKVFYAFRMDAWLKEQELKEK